MYCPFCGLALEKSPMFCNSCGRDVSFIIEIASTVCGTAVTGPSEIMPLSYIKNKSKKTVVISVGIMRKSKYGFKPIRGKTLPLHVDTQWSSEQLLAAASKKLKYFNQDMDDGECVLLYPDGSQIKNIPGTESPFTIEHYKEVIGKSYQRITLYVCTLEVFLSKVSEDEEDDEMPFSMSPHSDTEVATSLGSVSTVHQFEKYKEPKDTERKTFSKSKKKSKNTVVISVGIMKKSKYGFKPIRGKALPLNVDTQWSSEQLLAAASKKLKVFNQDMDDRECVLLYPDGSLIKNIPGTEVPFTIEHYKEAIGKPYQRITLYICSLKVLLSKSRADDSVSEEEDEDEEPVNTSPHSDTEVATTQGSISALPQFIKYQEPPKIESPTFSKSKKKSKQPVMISVGIMKKSKYGFKPIRGKTLPLHVDTQWSSEQLLEAASKKLKYFNQDMDDGECVLLYPDGSLTKNIPGTESPFTIEHYKEAIGKSYQRITLYVCTLEVFLSKSHGDDSVSEDEEDDEMPFTTSPHSDTEVATSLGSVSTVHHFVKYKEPKETDRKTFSKSKKKSKKTVVISVGIMKKSKYGFKPIRGKTLPLHVDTQWSSEQLLAAASKKLKCFNQDMDDGECVLLYPDGSLIKNIPGTEVPFTIEQYKEAIGKSYQRITLFVCTIEAMLSKGHGDDSISEDEEDDEVPFNMMSHSDTEEATSLGPASTVLQVIKCEPKEVERETFSKSKKKPKKTVKISVGIMSKTQYGFKPVRGKTLPLNVDTQWSSEQLLAAASKKLKYFNQDLEEGECVLLYPDGSQIKNIPGTESPFTIEHYKEVIGKPYQRITLFVCTIKVLLSKDDSVSEDEKDQEVPPNMSSFSDTVVPKTEDCIVAIDIL